MSQVKAGETERAARRRWGFRYSLRALLLMLTIASIGAWYWFRVPFVREANRPLTEQEWDFVEVPEVENVDPFKSPFRELLADERQRFRRVLIGEPLRHGRTELFFSGSRLPLGEEHWVEGQLHGAWSRRHRSGALAVRGEYRGGKRHGPWEYYSGRGDRLCCIHYEQGLPHGEAEGVFENEHIHTLLFEHGQIVSVDGRQVDDPLGEAVRTGAVADRTVGLTLGEPNLFDFLDTSLNDVADYYSNTLPVGVRLDSRALELRGVSTDLPVTFFGRPGTPASAALFLMLDRLDLVAVYRFEQVWITTRQGAREWSDRTGVSALIESAPTDLSPDEFSALVSALEREASFRFINVPILGVLAYVESRHHVRIECSEPLLVDRGDDRFPQIPITLSLSGISLEAALATMCEQLHARLRWGAGHRLFLELRPPTPSDP